MRDNRHQWQFYDSVLYPAISSSEVRYWKTFLSRVLKVGIEYEFNLREQKGKCKENDMSCLCIHILEDCWTKCINTEECAVTPNIEICANRNSKCKPSDCKTCENYKFQCLGLQCTNFISSCFECSKYERPCKSCEHRYDPDRDPDKIRSLLKDEFQPTNTYTDIGKSGVVSITTDGSLLGKRGVEVITVGRRLDYWEFYTMSKNIIDRVQQLGGYLNERTGAHMHVLSGYYQDRSTINELEKPMPAIIFANFHQLVRRYQNALTWITSTLSDPNHITRWEKFRKGILDISPVSRSASEICAKVADVAHGSKYGFVNYRNMMFTNNKEIDIFHVEFREADASMCPSYFAALACLHCAFVIKAVEISRYGLLKVGSREWLKTAKNMKKVILNGDGDYHGPRFSNTDKVLDYKDYFIAEALDMVSHMKNILFRFGPAYEVLNKLAVRPISLRRIDGDKWATIENDIGINISETEKFELRIDEIIDLNLIDDCSNSEEWASEVYKLLKEENYEGIDKNKVSAYIMAKVREGEIVWSESIGCMITI